MNEEFEKKLKEISEDIKNNNVIIFIKGTPERPMCGFSAKVLSILNRLDVEYASRDVISDPILREAIKEYSDWPTVPQIYINGEFVGGCDILSELYSSGELAIMLGI